MPGHREEAGVVAHSVGSMPSLSGVWGQWEEASMKLADIPGPYEITDEWHGQPTVRISSMTYGRIHWQGYREFVTWDRNRDNMKKNHMGTLHLDEGVYHIVIYAGA